MKTIIFVSVVALFSVNAFAIKIFCDQSAGNTCSMRVLSALTEMGCQPVAQELKCEVEESMANIEYCEVTTATCEEPRANLVITTSCMRGEKVSFKSFDSGLTLTWWMGWGPYLTDVCRF